jgi:hypothetical protein
MLFTLRKSESVLAYARRSGGRPGNYPMHADFNANQTSGVKT